MACSQALDQLLFLNGLDTLPTDESAHNRLHPPVSINSQDALPQTCLQVSLPEAIPHLNSHQQPRLALTGNLGCQLTLSKSLLESPPTGCEFGQPRVSWLSHREPPCPKRSVYRSLKMLIVFIFTATAFFSRYPRHSDSSSQDSLSASSHQAALTAVSQGCQASLQLGWGHHCLPGPMCPCCIGCGKD